MAEEPLPASAAEAIQCFSWRHIRARPDDPYRSLTPSEGKRLREAEIKGYYTALRPKRDLGEMAWTDICLAHKVPTLVVRLGKYRSVFVMHTLSCPASLPYDYVERYGRTIWPRVERAFRSVGIEMPPGYYDVDMLVAVRIRGEDAIKVADALVPVAATLGRIFRPS